MNKPASDRRISALLERARRVSPFSRLLYYEALGLCSQGDAANLLQSGATTLGGGENAVVNPSGGLIAKGHPPFWATGVAQVVEALEAASRPCRRTAACAKRASVSLQVTGGGIWGVDHACSINILSL